LHRCGTVRSPFGRPCRRWGGLPLERRSSKPAVSKARSASRAVHRGSLGIYLDSSGQNFTPEENIPLVVRKGFEVKLDGFLYVGHGILECVTLRLATLEFRAPGVKPVLILLDDALRVIVSVYRLARRWHRRFLGRNPRKCQSSAGRRLPVGLIWSADFAKIACSA
jgi:hypothetical protein